MSDVIALDNHRLLCGNAQVKSDVDKLLDGVQVDLLLTDPPYGIDIVKVIGERAMEHLPDTKSNLPSHSRQGTVGIGARPGFHKRERANGKVGKPRRCTAKTLQTSNW